jgi:hypothetical protein
LTIAGDDRVDALGDGPVAVRHPVDHTALVLDDDRDGGISRRV